MSGQGDEEPGHPLVRGWVRSDPGVPFGQGSTDPAVTRLVAGLGLGHVERDLSGMDNLTVLVDGGRHVLRSYKPFVTAQRIVELQRLRRSLQAAGLTTPVPVEIAGRSVHRCGQRWAEVEPFLQLPVPEPDPAAVFTGLGQLHRVLASLPTLSTADLRPSFVSVDVLREWVEINSAEEFLTPERGSQLRHLLDRVEERWIQPGSLPVQLIHTDPHPANILYGGGPQASEFVYLDFGGVEVAPRAHDLAVAVVYQLSSPANPMAHVVGQLPLLLDSYDRTNPVPLTRKERDAIPAYGAAVAAYYDICGWGPGWRSLGTQLLDLTSDSR